MKGNRAIFACFAAGAVFLLAGAVLAGDKPAEPEGKDAKPQADPKLYEVIKYVNPFSPDPPKRPEPPKPTPVKEDPKPVEKVKILPDNLHFAGVTYDNKTRALAAMIEVDGKPTLFLDPAGKVGAWEVVKVDMEGLLLKGKDGKTRTLELGTRFHDGVTVEWRVKGGAPPKKSTSSSGSSAGSGGSSSSKSSGGSVPKLDDARKREIIERLRKRREAAKQKKK